MRDMPSRFVEILDSSDGAVRISDADVRLEDILAGYQEAPTTPTGRARSSTQSSSKASFSFLDRDRGTERAERDGPPTSTSPAQQRWKRLGGILHARRSST
ncbi:hypothetical protein ASPZODRAFT_11968 [Penicilliopsis zonata CBS 506.65]|uniref:Uncharacterized protein n=1 Tax=Penicilliopsis zonata CBS 506.65 TaxID=1073090 RepID=A0A1L9SVN7_9EURO|nr:hypothetical protein ASPZODRAFT_11968 [Penicilliopsis zonata CBS 506.65]OJJ51123.1 hypothetical protein ASPZODRAFT_11968 [Penicilliopsis zonata CBS 506.65]